MSGTGKISVNTPTHQTQSPHYELLIELAPSTHDDLRYGMTGQVRLPAVAKPIGTSLVQAFLRFANSLHKG